MERRHFIQSLSLSGLSPIALTGLKLSEPVKITEQSDDRKYWVTTLQHIVQPVLFSLSLGQLRKRMPVEEKPNAARAKCTHLEAFGRVMNGIAPFLGQRQSEKASESVRKELLDLYYKGIVNAFDSASPDYLYREMTDQHVVDSAFLCEAFLRANDVLWKPLDENTKRNIIRDLKSTRAFKPGESNWLLFSAIIEVFLRQTSTDFLKDSIDKALDKFDSWYKGDSFFGDGSSLHFDYYNSIVIHPLLTDILYHLQLTDPAYKQRYELQLKRSSRQAAVLERMIAPDGSYPVIGRSLIYRCGVFHNLAMMAWKKNLESEISEAGIRSSLTAIIKKTLEPKNTFDSQGWLQIGLSGHQPSIGEGYISTGSLYLCTFAFLPLGLPETDTFWSTPNEDWITKKIWNGMDAANDHAIDF